MYIALDTETGGIGPDVSLLTAYFAILDANLNIIDELSLAIKPDDHIYHVTAEALNINKINLIEHEAVATTAGAAGKQLREFLIENSNNGSLKLIPVGHNVHGDLEKIYSEVLNRKEAQNYISYRLLDTGVIAQFMKACGRLPETISGSLGSLVEHFNVQKREAHNAKNDTLMTVAVLKEMILKDVLLP